MCVLCVCVWLGAGVPAWARYRGYGGERSRCSEGAAGRPAGSSQERNFRTAILKGALIAHTGELIVLVGKPQRTYKRSTLFGKEYKTLRISLSVFYQSWWLQPWSKALLPRGQLPHFSMGLRPSTHILWSKTFSETDKKKFLFGERAGKKHYEMLNMVAFKCQKYGYIFPNFPISQYCFISITFAMEKNSKHVIMVGIYW